MAKRLVRLPHVDQANCQGVEELERGELPILAPHGAIRMVLDTGSGQVTVDVICIAGRPIPL
jgi:hypothetical protein